MRVIRILIFALTLCAFTSLASADPIPITSGFLTGAGNYAPVEMSLAGGSFGFYGWASPQAGVWMPSVCHDPSCTPGYTLDLTARWAGLALTSITGPFIELTWMGSLLIPGDFTGGTLMAPFAFNGLYADGGLHDELVGSGLVTALFTPRPTGDFALSSISYEFLDDSEMAPNPEPGTMILLGTGIAALARRATRRT